MLFLTNSDFLIHLLITNVVLLISFFWVNHNYFKLKSRIENANIAYKALEEKHRKFLTRQFPFYNKLSPGLKRHFEERAAYFFYSKEYLGVEGVILKDSMKLLVSCYAAQVSFGLKNFSFSSIERVIIYPDKFHSEDSETLVSWAADNSSISFSWKHFYRELKKDINNPMGLVVMASAIKKEYGNLFVENIFGNVESFMKLYSNYDKKEKIIFPQSDFSSKEAFLNACIRHYFIAPMQLKNQYPEVFKRIDKILYQEVVKPCA
jgi:Mlc titration factor MtfA (ptsG expression regulator)